MRHPREMPHSGSSSVAATPVMSLMPGQTPPESCHPPPEPPSHSPKRARARTSRRSDSSSDPVNEEACPVARIQTLMSEPSKFVLTANRDPLGMSLTLEHSSRPRPGPTMRASKSARDCPEPSMPGGTTPAAMTAAFSNPRWSLAKSKTSLNAVMSAVAPRSTEVRRSSGSSSTRSQALTGGRGAASRPWTPRSTEMFSTLAPSG